MDCIKLLPDNIANQIAAGEVVQRPASVVKELLENALDAGATEIRLQVKEGGTLLIQITDNGSGMSAADARMCWERHATSKIRQTEDLFRISSFGFRGEALASIAAVAMVEMKTKRKEDETGTVVAIEGGRIKDQSPAACLNGTQFTVRNLFFNVPARRNFLKSTAVELRHIIDEFIRVAMPHPSVAMSLTHNDKEVFDLQPGTLARRVAELTGKKNEKDFLTVDEDHELLRVRGFIGKPETARRTRGEQFLFVNNRYIRDAYLNHAVVNAYDQMISKEQFPMYALFLETDPGHIDINIHPTKTEIKFDDERAMYTLVKSAVRKALGQYVSIPEIEFGDPNTFNPVAFSAPSGEIPPARPEIRVDRSFNPFADGPVRNTNSRNWQQLFGNPYLEQAMPEPAPVPEFMAPAEKESFRTDEFIQPGDGYIVTGRNKKLIIIDQRAAHERILFEKYTRLIQLRKAPVQQLLFPRTVELSGPEYALAHEIMEEMKEIGFDVADFGTNCLIINGVPADTPKGFEKELLEGILEYCKLNGSQHAEDKRRMLALAMASREAVLRTHVMDKKEAASLIEELFACEHPAVRPNGKPVYIEFSTEKITEFFR